MPLTATIDRRNPLATILGQLMFVARLLLMVASLFAGLVLHNLWRLFRQPSPWPRLFLLSISWTAGIATATTGKRVRKNIFYAANHHSWIDIPVMSGVTGCTFVANDGIEKWPLIGWLCKINNTIFVSRENRLSVGDQVDDLREAMTGDQPVTIFQKAQRTMDRGCYRLNRHCLQRWSRRLRACMSSQCFSAMAATRRACPGSGTKALSIISGG